MDKNNLQEINKVCSDNSLLVVNQHGIFRLYCPFKAVCIAQISTYAIGQQVVVISVKMDNNSKLVYIIQNKGFYHHYFMIVSESKAG